MIKQHNQIYDLEIILKPCLTLQLNFTLPYPFIFPGCPQSLQHPPKPSGTGLLPPEAALSHGGNPLRRFRLQTGTLVANEAPIEPGPVDRMDASTGDLPQAEVLRRRSVPF